MDMKLLGESGRVNRRASAFPDGVSAPSYASVWDQELGIVGCKQMLIQTLDGPHNPDFCATVMVFINILVCRENMLYVIKLACV